MSPEKNNPVGRAKNRELFNAVVAKIRSHIKATNALSETREAFKERSLISQSLAEFANQASLQLSGYDANEGYGRNRVISGMKLSSIQVKKAKLILSRKGSCRNFPEAIFLRDLIRTLHVAVVNDLSDNELTYLATCVDGVNVQPGQSVFEIGDFGDRFFIVLNGSLTVHAPSATNELSQVGVLSSGRGFGERSILDKEPRKATIRAAQPSLLMSMSRATFNWMMQALFDKKLQEKLDFFVHLPLCKRWTRRDVLRLALPFHNVDIRRGAILCKEGDTRQTLDIIVQGQLFVRRNSVQIASIGPGIAIEAYEALNGYPCRNTVQCSLQTSALIFSVSCNDLMVALRSSNSALTSLIDNLQMMRHLMDAHYESAAAGHRQRDPEPQKQKTPMLNSKRYHKVIKAEEMELLSSASMRASNREVDRNINIKSSHQMIAANAKGQGRIHTNQEDFAFPERFPYTIALISDELDEIGMTTTSKPPSIRITDRSRRI